ncbi:hypothetical protein [Actinoplanes couchii]|nr:hypothetical protein [Actinoplanes couchii]MDR6317432.1 hypothetical protein [Actinoplanes couchii]
MLRRLPATAAVMTVLALTTGCTPGPKGAPAEAATASPSASVDPDSFVGVVRAQLPEIAAGRTDRQIQDIAATACTGLAAGRPGDEIVDTTRALGTTDADATDHATARELIKLAIDRTCLPQAPRVDEF